MISWLVGQAVWAWAKAGIWESEYAYAYPNEDEGIHEEYQDNEEKPPVDAKDEKLFDQKVLINRTRPEACDQEVNFVIYQLHYMFFNFLFYSNYIIFFLILLGIFVFTKCIFRHVRHRFRCKKRLYEAIYRSTGKLQQYASSCR